MSQLEIDLAGIEQLLADDEAAKAKPKSMRKTRGKR